MKPSRPLKGPRRKPVRAPLTMTTCPACETGPWNGDVVWADDKDCPACRKGDKVEGRAKFAPSKRGTLVPDTGTEVEE
jgi:hypothetical protein